MQIAVIESIFGVFEWHKTVNLEISMSDNISNILVGIFI